MVANQYILRIGLPALYIIRNDFKPVIWREEPELVETEIRDKGLFNVKSKKNPALAGFF